MIKGARTYKYFKLSVWFLKWQCKVIKKIVFMLGLASMRPISNICFLVILVNVSEPFLSYLENLNDTNCQELQRVNELTQISILHRAQHS